jgi:hypothetical protein
VKTEDAVLMRMNAVPRSVAESVGKAFHESVGALDPASARLFLRNLTDADWAAARPPNATMSGADYRSIWSTLSGERQVQ